VTLRDQILAAWAACKNDEERGKVLLELTGALHEVRIERLPNQGALRTAMDEMDRHMVGLTMGGYSVAWGEPWTRDRHPTRAAQIGVVLDIEAALLAEMRGRAFAELTAVQRGEPYYHAERLLHVALAQKPGHARPMDGYTAHVYEPRKDSAPCTICKAPTGSPCTRPA
jgi:hypothetical protein